LPPLEQAGTFRGQIVSYGGYEPKSGAKAVAITVLIEEIWEDGEWRDWREYKIEAEGNVWVVGKDGTLNERQVRNLVDNAGWDGSFLSVVEARWKPTPVQIVVQEDEYRGVVRFPIAFINAYDSTPGGGNMTVDAARAIDSSLGPQIRALTGNQARNTAPAPADGPQRAAKPKGGKQSKPVSKAAPPASQAPETPADDIPF